MKDICPLFKVPGRTKMSDMVDNKYEVLSHKIKLKLKCVTKISLTTDIWTDTLNTQSYLGVTAHFLDFDVKKIVSYTIAVKELDERHESPYIGSELLNICRVWEISTNEIAFITTDNANNMVKAVCDTFGKNKHMRCFAHTINLVANTPFDEKDGIPDLKILLSSVKSICKFFKQSVIAADELRKQTNLKLIQSVVTRWNSTFYQLERFHQLSSHIASILLTNSKAPSMLKASDMDIIEDLLNIYRPFEKITKDLSGEHYSTGGLVIPLVHLLERQLLTIHTKTDIGTQTKHMLLKEIDSRFQRIEQNWNLAISTILDPKFKKVHFQNSISCATAVKILSSKIVSGKISHTSIEESTQSDDEDDHSLWAFTKRMAKETGLNTEINLTSNEKNNELKAYLCRPIENVKDVVSYWCNQKAQSLSNLWEIALEHHILMATSVPSERVFSLAGNVLTDKRNRLQKLNKILFLKSLSLEEWSA